MLRIAHRGYQNGFPENSLASIREALLRDFDGVEFDVQECSDRTLFVLHDATLDRTTTFKGKIRDFTAAELRNCRLSNGEKLPRLVEVLKLFKNTSKKLFLEYKGQGEEQQIYTLLKRYSLLNRTIIEQFDYSSLKKFRAIDTTMKLLYLKGKLTVKDVPRALALHCYALGMHPFYARKKLVKEAHAHNILIIPYSF